MIRRSFLNVGDDLAIDFANTVPRGTEVPESLASWRSVVDFLELRGAVGPAEGGALRAMAGEDAHGCAAALERAYAFRSTVRDVLATLARRRPVAASAVERVNEALGWGAGAGRLVRRGAGWGLAHAPGVDGPLRALAPVARALALLIAAGRDAGVRQCANPTCVLYFRDRSRARRRRWCSMAVCGNRMKVAAHARRHGRPPHALGRPPA
jgi:predicted RNA-binding Zn ribbon-like protein